jgi:formylglycine-generating enzyme required for sulfatase activity
MKFFILLLAIIGSTSGAFAQCLANHKEALKVCEGTYLKHYEFSNAGVSSVDIILSKGGTYLFYVLNTNIDIEQYALRYSPGDYSYPFVSYEKNDQYLSYIITPEKSQKYTIELNIDTSATACALIGIYYKKTSVEKHQKLSQRDNPPGTVKVAENLYFDITEVKNVDYREYLYWLKNIHGKAAEVYAKAVPDTNVWRTKLSYNAPYSEYYLRHPAYAEYPLVGISYDQAVAFCKWRSDRLNESMYIKENKIKPIIGEPVSPVPEVVRYRLPTKAEWEKYASSGFDAKNSKKLAKYNYTYGNFKPKANTVKETMADHADITAPVESYFPNQLGLYNMFGNVAEMVAEKGMAKGGSWKHTETETFVKKDFSYTKPTDWLGFRCVCEKAEKRTVKDDFIAFDKNLYAAKYETTNKEYNQFIAYLKQKGDVELLKKCVPDSSQWKKTLGEIYNQPMSYLYHWHPSYGSYPVVNITKEAMEEYCKWKSNAFFITKEFPLKKVIYRLPTEEEWKKLANPKLGHTLPWHGNSPIKKEGKDCNCPYANLKIYDYSINKFDYGFDGEYYTGVVGQFDPNDLGIYDVIGNVTEMTQEGVLKGGSFFNTLEESDITKNQDFELPHPCVGFRVIVEVVE